MSDHDTETGIDDIWRDHRPYLVDLAFRMLGSIQDAEDVVQEAFARLLRVDIDAIDEIRGWLIVVVSRLCLDQLRSAQARRGVSVGSFDDSRLATALPQATDPADRVTLDDRLSMALLVVLEQLSPPERAVFVLHDVFQFPFDQVAAIVGRTPAASRQLASRARRRIQAETGPGRFEAGSAEHHQIAERFIAACAGGDIESLMQLLDPDVVGVVDLGPGAAARPPVRGMNNVSRGVLTFFGPTTGITLVSHPVNGQPGLLAFRDRQLAGILAFKVGDGRIYDIHAIADAGQMGFIADRMGPRQ